MQRNPYLRLADFNYIEEKLIEDIQKDLLNIDSKQKLFKDENNAQSSYFQNISSDIVLIEARLRILR